MNIKDLDWTGIIKEAVKDADNADDIVQKIDVDKVKGKIDNDYVNPIVKKNKEEHGQKVKGQAVEEFVKEAGIDGVQSPDDLKSYAERLSSTASEKDKQLNEVLETKKKLENELNEYKPKVEELSSKLQERETFDTITEKGFRKDYAKDVHAIARNKVTDDKPLEKVLDEMKETHSWFLSETDSGSFHDDDGSGGSGPKDKDAERDKWRREAGLK